MRERQVIVPHVERELTFALHEARDQYISEEIFDLGYWEPLETEVVTRMLDSGDVFVDAGANLGWYSVIAASTGATVFAFEPAPGNLILLKHNLRVNGVDIGVTVFEAGLGSAEGTGHLQLSDDNQGDHRVVITPGHRSIVVPIMTLDSVLTHLQARLVKIDTQGSEVSILRGGRTAIANAAAHETSFILEFWPYGLAHCGASAEELIGLLSPLIGRSHLCFEIDEKRRELRPIELQDLGVMASGGDYSPQAGGHTNILVLASGFESRVVDLIALHRSRDSQS